jgi:phage regulator Rha-like protein
MTTTEGLIEQQDIENRIFTVRGVQVMIDSHLAELYGVETRRLNEQVQRNKDRFPSEFMFRLTLEEYEFLRSQNVFLNDSAQNLRSQNATSSGITQNLKLQIGTSSSEHGGRRYPPYVFTEQGVAMLSAVLRSETAVKVSIQIIQAFVQMRKFIADNAAFFHRLERIERKQLETDEKFERIFDALQSKDHEPLQGIFYDGQVFDAYTFVAGLVRKAQKSIILIDNYIDDTVLTIFSKRNKGVSVTIFTKNISKQMALDVQKFNTQYEPVKIKELKEAHDRFLILDDNELYHFGASLKDLGKKWFAFSKMEAGSLTLIEKLKTIKS